MLSSPRSPGKDNPDFFFRRIPLPRLAADVLDAPVSSILATFGLLSHRLLHAGNDVPKTLS
jgi:hypothetical protein